MMALCRVREFIRPVRSFPKPADMGTSANRTICMRSSAGSGLSWGKGTRLRCRRRPAGPGRGPGEPSARSVSDQDHGGGRLRLSDRPD
jgi:hypothetical protein